jgi:hypothetical protein
MEAASEIRALVSLYEREKERERERERERVTVDGRAVSTVQRLVAN